MSALNKINLDPVGFVQTEAVGKEVRDKTVISQIIFREELTEALEGVEEFSHLFVLFWLHEMSDEDRKIMKVHPRGRRRHATAGNLCNPDTSPPKPNRTNTSQTPECKRQRNYCSGT